MVFNDPSTVKISRHFIERWQHFPNSTIANRPLYIYHRAFSPASASQLSRAVKSAGIVEPQWTYSMYKTAHFHSTTAEILYQKA
ncbi:hypothetical protein KEM55_006993 [Ascosphaera atra]|nr:hypothetical protein KEM55_006993 [Ascosphaera atra]